MALWCEEQSQLVSPTQQQIEPPKSSETQDLSQEQESPPRVPRFPTESLLLEAHTELCEDSESDAFFTCQSQRRTVSSRLSSAVSAVFKYTDKEHGVVLIEKRMPVSSGTR